MNEFIQTIIVLLIVLWSIRLTLKRYLPNWLYVQQKQLANYCHQHQFVGLANWLQPVVSVKISCDNGCGSCSQGCFSSSKSEQVVKIIDKM